MIESAVKHHQIKPSKHLLHKRHKRTDHEIRGYLYRIYQTTYVQ